MKINNKLFLITATLGLMAAGSATAFANHSNYVYVTNNTTHQITATESWKSGGRHQHFYNGSNGHSCSPLTMNIQPGGTTTFREDENSGWDHYSGGRFSNYGVGLFTFQQSGITLNDTVDFQYHVYYNAAKTSPCPTHCEWNRLDSATILNTNGTPSTGVYVGNTTQALQASTNTAITCSDHTHMYMSIGSPNTSRTSSPMGKLSNMLQNFKL